MNIDRNVGGPSIDLCGTISKNRIFFLFDFALIFCFLSFLSFLSFFPFFIITFLIFLHSKFFLAFLSIASQSEDNELISVDVFLKGFGCAVAVRHSKVSRSTHHVNHMQSNPWRNTNLWFFFLVENRC